jgi:predicted TIM-barrel fold metal-dependent hydrolase
MAAAGVGRAIIAPVAWEGARNDIGLAAAKAYPDKFAVTGQFDADLPDARERLASWRQQPGMVGIRLTAPIAEESPVAGWFWRDAEAAGVPVVISPAAAGLSELDGIAGCHPGLRLVIDHFAAPRDTMDDKAFEGLDRLIRLARHANVAVKASALPAYSSEAYPFPGLHTHIRRVYDAFGPKRLFWGSDLTRLPCSYSHAVTMFTEELSWLTADDKAWIMGRALCNWIGWPLSGQGSGQD